MGIDTDSKLLVGAGYDELDSWFERMTEETGLDVHDLIEEYFEYMSPYYDSSPDAWFVGFAVPNNQAPTQEWFEVVQETAFQFEILTGVRARLYGGAHVW